MIFGMLPLALGLAKAANSARDGSAVIGTCHLHAGPAGGTRDYSYLDDLSAWAKRKWAGIEQAEPYRKRGYNSVSHDWCGMRQPQLILSQLIRHGEATGNIHSSEKIDSASGH